jgi:hypothetical protein
LPRDSGADVICAARLPASSPCATWRLTYTAWLRPLCTRHQSASCASPSQGLAVPPPMLAGDPPCKRPRTASQDASVRTPPVADVLLTGGGSDGSGSEGVAPTAAPDDSPSPPPQPRPPPYAPVRTHTGFENALRRGQPGGDGGRFVQGGCSCVPWRCFPTLFLFNLRGALLPTTPPPPSCTHQAHVC